ncbi:hypothetical protein [Paradesulfitobacterium ferrireducens]|uniref:hypothetical protein n=1 Tax=Paradesulfitobacterium ferrireducens TaxID=2816476 RepID=UPI001A90A647|nr:hypothetical protein [Paradesulfitobacterium ferrireducens]
MDDRESLEKQLQQVETELADLIARWPAHSVKPDMIFKRDDLEEERDRLKELLK